jgi:hypothetical protein
MRLSAFMETALAAGSMAAGSMAAVAAAVASLNLLTVQGGVICSAAS